ncbi:MAG: D-alanine--D-alanine ligase [Deltaproteobacteria bacterium]|nr:D-alanine--D-alanine ligase [Deltaproteobacteria bacterium]
MTTGDSDTWALATTTTTTTATTATTTTTMPTTPTLLTPLRVAVLMGGPSNEHDVSLTSGRQVLAALGRHNAFEVLIERDGTFRVAGDVQPNLGAALTTIAARADVAFIALHGPFGEDGTVQALLEASGVPYTGSGVLASALAMDKVRTKALYKAEGLPTPGSTALSARQWRRDPGAIRTAVAKAGEAFGFPCVAKPSTLGSSFGLSMPADATQLLADVEHLLGRGHDVLLEQYVRGRELTCGVLDVEREGTTRALPLTEIVPRAHHAYFDYVAKYTPGESEEITPARVPDAVSEAVQDCAIRAHRALGCRDMSRSDFLLDAEGRIFMLETNTIPGFTKTSLLPQGAAAVGIDFRALTEILVDNAWRRGAPRTLCA